MASTSKTIQLSKSKSQPRISERATVTMDPANPNIAATISVKKVVKNKRGRTVSTTTETFTQSSVDGLFKDSNGKNWSRENDKDGGIIRSAMGKIVNKSSVDDATAKLWQAAGRANGVNLKEYEGGASGKGNDPGSSVPVSFPPVTTSTPARKKYDQKLMYPSSLMDGISDFVKIAQHEYIPAGDDMINIGESASERIGNKSRVLGNVILPMPPGLLDNNSASWDNNNINTLQAAGVGAALQVMNASNGFDEAAAQVAGLLATAQGEGSAYAQLAKTKLISGLPGLNQSAGQLLARTSGKILNPNTELLFSGPAIRNFTYSFRMTPRNPEETRTIKKIIRFFKQGMSVKSSPGHLYMKSPNVFQVKFFHGSGKEHTFVNKLKMCAMTGFGVNYVPDGTYMTLPDSSMTAYEITMSLQEMDPVLDQDYTRLDGDSDQVIGY